jgi:hypothetical protein
VAGLPRGLGLALIYHWRTFIMFQGMRRSNDKGLQRTGAGRLRALHAGDRGRTAGGSTEPTTPSTTSSCGLLSYNDHAPGWPALRSCGRSRRRTPEAHSAWAIAAPKTDSGLTDPLVRRGKAVFDGHCRTCHGIPT